MLCSSRAISKREDIMKNNYFFKNLKKLKTYAHVKDVYIRLKFFLNEHLPSDYYCIICNISLEMTDAGQFFVGSAHR